MGSMQSKGLVADLLACTILGDLATRAAADFLDTSRKLSTTLQVSCLATSESDEIQLFK